ncbi:MAG: cysteine desulfurase, partial [Defluviitaleaceae bacterium]|nr:cysteine desulfurase [Defluviitaleaceae bacterium]
SIIGAKPNEIFFTSGGTEANNLAIFGAAKKPKGRRIITTRSEHPSVLAPLAKLAEKGDFEICYFSNIDELRPALSEQTCLVSTYHINNETGSIQDIAEIGNIIKQISPSTLFHVDAAQSFCKFSIDVYAAKIDLMTLSAHKIGGFKGCGALYIKNGVSIHPMIWGGGQEGGLRSGTENVGGIAAFAATTLDFWQNTKENFDHALALSKKLCELLGTVDGISFNNKNTSPYILDIDIKKVRSEVLVNALSSKGVFVSSGAACSAGKKLKTSQRSETALRISFGTDNTLEEIEKAANALIECIDVLRKSAQISRR